MTLNKKESLLNSSLSVINNIVSILVGFLTQTIFIKLLGSEFLGLNSLFSNIISLMSVVELGIGNAIIFNLYEPMYYNDREKIKSLVHFYNKTYNIIILIIFLISLILIPLLPFFVETDLDVNIYMIYGLFIFNVLSSYFLSYKRGILYSDKKNYLLSIIHICYILLLNLLRILILVVFKNYYLYLIVKIIMNFIENYVISIIVNKKYSFINEKKYLKLDKKVERNIFNKVKSLFLYKIAAFFVNSTDSIVISKYLGLHIMGLYSNYYLIINSLNTLITQAITSLTSNIGHLLVENDKNKNYFVFKKILLGNYWVAVVTSCCIYLIMDPFVKIWLGNSFLLSEFVLIVLVLNYFQNIMRSTFTIFKDGAGLYEFDKFVPVIQTLLNIIFSIILVKIFGLAGVFMGTIISELVWWIFSYPKLIYCNLFNQKISKYVKMFFKYLIIFILILATLYLFDKLFYFDNIIVELFYKIILALFIPNLVLVIVYFKEEEFKYYLNIVKKGVGKKK